MDPVTLSMIAMGVGGAIKIAGSLFDDTAGKQAALMRKEADLKQSALEETMRRAEGEQTQVLSSTKARMAGTGFASDSNSFTDYLSGMASQFTAQNAYAQKAGMESIDLIREGADIVDDPWRKILGVGADVAGTAAGFAGLMKPGGG
jgi:hypothetical protein